MYTQTCLLISLLLAFFYSAYFFWLVWFRQEKSTVVEFYYPTRLIWIDCLTFKISKSSIEGNGTFFFSVWTISAKSQAAAQSLWSWVLGIQMRNGLSSSWLSVTSSASISWMRFVILICLISKHSSMILVQTTVLFTTNLLRGGIKGGGVL